MRGRGSRRQNGINKSVVVWRGSAFREAAEKMFGLDASWTCGNSVPLCGRPWGSTAAGGEDAGGKEVRLEPALVLRAGIRGTVVPQGEHPCPRGGRGKSQDGFSPSLVQK